MDAVQGCNEQELIRPACLPAWLLPMVVVPLAALLLLLASRRGSRRRSSKQLQQRLPPSPPGLPIIGHLHLIGGLPHVSLACLAAKHGDSAGLMLLRLGAVPNLVASSPRAARLVLRTHDHVFSSRPASAVAHALVYGSSDIAFAPYGDHWRQVRKLVTKHLLAARKVKAFGRARQDEVRQVVARIREAAAAGAAVDMSEAMNTYANIIICRAVCGKVEGRNKLFRELIQMNTRLLGGFNLQDYFPGLASCWRRLRLTNHRDAKEVNRRWDDLLEEIIGDHEASLHRRRGEHRQEEESEEEDFVDVLLSVQQEYGITRDHAKAILMDMFAAGTDTSAVTLEAAMGELMRHPEAMAKLQAEVREKTPARQQMVQVEELPGMAYLRAVVKETLRLHPPCSAAHPSPVHDGLRRRRVHGALRHAGHRQRVGRRQGPRGVGEAGRFPAGEVHGRR